MSNIDSQLAVLENQYLSQRDTISRIDSNMEKLTACMVSNNQIIAIHNEKLERHETKHLDHSNKFELQRQEMSHNIKEIYHKVDATAKSLLDEMAEMERKMLNTLDDLKRNIKEDIKAHHSLQEEHDKRLTSLEKWRWMLVGAGVMGGFFLDKITTIFDIVSK